MTFDHIANPATTYDEGLRAYMVGIYNRLFGGLILTAVLAFAAAHDPLSAMLFKGVGKAMTYTGLGWIVALAPLGLILGLGWTGAANRAGPAAFLFWAVAALFGLSLGSVVLLYTGTSIASTLFVTAGAFGALSLYGYTTKRSLSALGAGAFFALIGLILLMVVNIFVRSSGLDLLISAAGIVVFAILTAYDTQKLKDMYDDSPASERIALSNLGALTLYLDFVNLFLFFLRFMGVKTKD